MNERDTEPPDNRDLDTIPDNLPPTDVDVAASVVRQLLREEAGALVDSAVAEFKEALSGVANAVLESHQELVREMHALRAGQVANRRDINANRLDIDRHSEQLAAIFQHLGITPTGGDLHS